MKDRFRLVHVPPGRNTVHFERHVRGQLQALADFRVDFRAKAGFPADERRNVSLVQLVETEGGRAIGGMSVQFRRDGFQLATEVNLADPELTQEIESQRHRNPCEISGAWIDRDFRRLGLLPHLFYGTVAAARLGGAGICFSSAHAKAAAHYEPLGVAVDYDKPYPWPSAEYRTYVVRVDLDRYCAYGRPESAIVRAIAEDFRSGRPFDFELRDEALPLAAGG